MSSTMQAAVTAADGGFEMATVDRPIPGPTEVLVRVEAAGINPADWKTRDATPMGPGVPDGTILGWDIAGTVSALGPGVNRFKVGDRVFGMPRFPAFASAYAQYATARARELSMVPEGMSTVQAGALPLAGLTAWQGVVDTLQVTAGERLLIHAASGGVGHLAVQVAKAQGAEVWGTASPRNHERLRELGVDHLIDYRTEQFEDVVSELDAVFDLVGDGETASRSLSVLRKGGRLASISPMIPDDDALNAADVTASFVLVEPDYGGLDALADLSARGLLEVIIGEQRPLTEMTALHETGLRGSPMGKLVATVDHPNVDQPNVDHPNENHPESETS